MIGKSIVDVLRKITGDRSIETIADGLEKALSGGGGGGEILLVNFEEVEQGKLSADKTFEEIDAAMLGGQIVIGVLHVVVGGSMRVFDGYDFVIFATGSYNVTFSDTKYRAQSGDDYWIALQS